MKAQLWMWPDAVFCRNVPGAPMFFFLCSQFFPHSGMIVRRHATRHHILQPNIWRPLCHGAAYANHGGAWQCGDDQRAACADGSSWGTLPPAHDRIRTDGQGSQRASGFRLLLGSMGGSLCLQFTSCGSSLEQLLQQGDFFTTIPPECMYSSHLPEVSNSPIACTRAIRMQSLNPVLKQADASTSGRNGLERKTCFITRLVVHSLICLTLPNGTKAL